MPDCERCRNSMEVRDVNPEGEPLELCFYCAQDYYRQQKENDRINARDAELESRRLERKSK